MKPQHIFAFRRGDFFETVKGSKDFACPSCGHLTEAVFVLAEDCQAAFKAVKREGRGRCAHCFLCGTLDEGEGWSLVKDVDADAAAFQQAALAGCNEATARIVAGKQLRGVTAEETGLR